MTISDFRSDTVTRPTPEMRRALANAVVGDDVLGDDPTVIRLEAAVADLFGKAAGLFVPSGTMGNQIAANVHAAPGTEVILEEASHCLDYEVGGLGYHSRLQTRPVPGERGAMDPGEVRSRLREATIHTPGTGLVIVENTHNFAGGAIVPIEVLREIRGACRDAGVPLHMDGARIWHAAVATGVPLDEWAAEADSVMACLSKGLGAPVGSILVGTAEFIDRARRMRKMFGGGMRQVGILAAAGFVAIETGLGRLAEDHERARHLADGLAALPGVVLDPATVQTNIVISGLSGMTPTDFVERMEDEGVLLFPAGPDVVRYVTHRDLSDTDVERALTAAAAVLGAEPGEETRGSPRRSRGVIRSPSTGGRTGRTTWREPEIS